MLRTQVARPSTHVEIEDLVSAWADAWNRHDAEAAAALVMPEIDFVNVHGCWLRGKDEFIAHHRRLHSTQMRASTWSNLAYEARCIGDELAIVHLEWTIEGDEDPDGTPRRRRRGLFTWVVVRVEKAWRVAAAHNTDCIP